MIRNYEKQKIIFYLSNALQNKKFVTENFDGICTWIFSKSQEYLPYKWGDTPETDNEGAFRTLAYNSRATALLKIQNFADKLTKLPLARQKYAPDILMRNLQHLKQLFSLTDIEINYLEFLLRENNDNSLLYNLISDLNLRHHDLTAEENAVFLKISPSILYNISQKQNRLCKLGLLEVSYDGQIETTNLTKHFYFQRFDSSTDIAHYILGKKQCAYLAWDDFKHITDAEILAKLLRNALKMHKTGINILFYGEPGTGKTEFAKTLAQKISADLYAIGENTDSYVEEEENARYEQLQRTQIILKNTHNTLLMVDECDDLLTATTLNKRELSKIKVNRLLEANRQPIIWISNSIWRMDKAYLRRFSYAINFTRPTLPVLQEMWKKSLKSNNLPCDEKTAEEFSTKYSLSPSFISTAVSSASLVGGGLKSIVQTLDRLQEAYNNGDKPQIDNKPVSLVQFNPALLNTDINLTTLSERICSLHKLNFSLCLYGASGTGKTAFAQYLGEKLQLPIIKKRCSDLIDKYVGETEKNIASAFEEAKLKQALLVFDEADSFLQERSFASHSWEVTQVNEMLTQMEKHSYPFICTTNLMESLDKASLRRFTFKVRYDYMTDAQRTSCFEYFFNIKNADLSAYPSLTPGDFIVVKQKAEILGCLNDKNELIKLLESEQLNKAPISRKIGFI